VGKRHDALVMSKIAFVFPGQGSQSVGMGKDLFENFAEAREVFGAADDALSEADDGRLAQGKLSTLCFEGPEDQLRLTANAQPAILTMSLAAHAVARKRLPPPDYVAGHSLGEFSALAATEAFPLQDAVRAVRARGRLMQDAVPVGQGAMSAVLGLASEQVALACRETEAELALLGRPAEKVQLANLNEPSQTVISGHAEAVAMAGARALALGAKKVIPLPVSAPFHSSLMEPVQGPLRELLQAMAFKAPTVPVVTNVEAAPNADPDRIVSLLVAQVTAPVRWVETILQLRALGVDRFVELGPGRVLSGLIKRIDRAAQVFNVEDPTSLEKTEAGMKA
jgi:[acyl-carrier-protein] S-malonyltransferase